MQIFIGTPELCLKVKEEVIERIFDLVLDSDDDYTKAQLLETLQALAKVHHNHRNGLLALVLFTD